MVTIKASSMEDAKAIGRGLTNFTFDESQDPLSFIPGEWIIFGTATGGDIKALIRETLRPQHLAAATPKLKRPFHHFISAIRALGTTITSTTATRNRLVEAGHLPYSWQTPDGYPDEELPWMGTLMWRWNFSLALAGGKQPGARVNLTPLIQALRTEKRKEPDAATWFGHLIGRKPTEKELAAVALPTQSKKNASPEYAAESKQTVGLILASPAFQRC